MSIPLLLKKKIMNFLICYNLPINFRYDFRKKSQPMNVGGE